MSVQQKAEKLVRTKVRKYFKVMSDQEESEFQDLSGVTIPANIPKLKDMTDEQLIAIKEALRKSHGRAVNVETQIRSWLLKVDEELVKRES